MRTKLAVVGGGVGLLLAMATAPVLAHHAFSAEFDANKPIKLRGTITRMEWINPHAWLHIEVKGPDGKATEWMVEGGTPNTVLRRGITKESLKPGAEVLVEGFEAKSQTYSDGIMRANGRDITYPDGRKLFFGSAGTGAPGDAAGAGRYAVLEPIARCNAVRRVLG